MANKRKLREIFNFGGKPTVEKLAGLLNQLFRADSDGDVQLALNLDTSRSDVLEYDSAADEFQFKSGGAVVPPGGIPPGGSLTVIDLVQYAIPTSTKSEVPGVDTTAGTPDFAGILEADPSVGEPLIDILIPAPTGPDLAKFDDGGGNHEITVTDDGTTGTPTPVFTTASPGQGLLVELNNGDPSWTLDALIAALNAWGLANLSTTPATIASLNPSSPHPGGTSLGIIGPELVATLTAGGARISVLEVALTNPSEEVMYDNFNSVGLRGAVVGPISAEAFPGFGIGVLAAGASGRPGSGVVQFVKHFTGQSEQINSASFDQGAGLLCLVGDTVTMATLISELETLLSTATVTLLNGLGTDLCSVVFPDEDTSTVAALIGQSVPVGQQNGIFADFDGNGGSRYHRVGETDPAETGLIEIYPPSTNSQ